MMSETLKKEVDKWEEATKKFIDKAKKTEKGVGATLQKDFDKIEADGKALMAKIDKEAVKAEGATKNTLKSLRDRAHRVHQGLSDDWKKLRKK